MDVEKKFDASKFTKQWEKARRKISVGACAAEIQCEPIVSLDPRIVGTKTGPLTGMMCAKEQLAEDCPDGDEKSDVSDVENPDFLNDLPSSGDGGTLNWDRPIQETSGESPGSTTPYWPSLTGRIGDPRRGRAARSAVRGSMECLNRKLFDSQYPLKTTRDVMNAILQSFDSAHKCILQTEGATSSSLVCRRGVRTRQAGAKQELTNPTCGCGFLPVHENDIVFLVTDGIFENFDPVVLLDKRAQKTAGTPKKAQVQPSSVLHWSHKRVEHLSSGILVESLIEYAIDVTDQKRKFLERWWSDLDYINAEDRSSKEHEILKIADDFPGKVDHATAVAYEVGYLTDGQRHTGRKAFFSRANSLSNSH
eukprot:Em0562g3a